MCALNARGWLPTRGPNGQPLPIFGIYTWRSAITMSMVIGLLLGLAWVITPYAPSRDGYGRLDSIPWPLALSCIVWWWTFALFGIGSTEQNAKRRFEIACGAGLVASFAGIELLHAYLTQRNFASPDAPWSAVWTLTVDVLLPVSVAFWQDRHYEASRERSRVEAARLERERDARALVEARLQVLQAQIEPHFVFNAMSHLEALTEQDPPRAGQMVRALSRYLRESMPAGRDAASTVGHEVDRARAYLDIMRIRMGDRLAYGIDVPPDLADARFPPFMIATLVENAIKHGVEPKPRGGRIDIVAARSRDDLCVSVRDDGMGFAPQARSGSGVGLANVRERLHALFGDAATLDIEPNEPCGVVATIRIPARAPQADGHAERADR
jgi:signal transduction histidine kinase